MRLGFNPLDQGILDPGEALGLAAELGLGLELPFELFEAVPGLPSPEELGRRGRELGVGFTLHLPFVDLNLASLFPRARWAALERVREGLEFARRLGAEVAVLHTGSVPNRHPLVLAAARERLEEALNALLPLPVPVAVENLSTGPEDLIQGPEELAELLERHPQYGFCLDLSHAYIEGGAERVRRYQEVLGDRLLHLHLNDTPGDADRHLPVGRGRVPYRELKPSRLPATAAFEVRGGRDELTEAVETLQNLWDI